jgi:PAS domain S-box-containing protein
MLKSFDTEQSSIHRTLRGGYFLAFFLLAVSVSLVYFTFVKFDDTAQKLSLSQEFLLQTEKILDAMLEIESGARGYAFTGNPSYLEQYNDAHKNLAIYLNNMEHLITDDEQKQEKFKELLYYSDKKKNFTQQLLRIREEKGLEAALAYIQADSGRHFMDKFKELIHHFKDEKNTSNKHRKHYSEWQFWLKAAFVSLLILMTIYLVFSIRFIRFNLNKRIQAEQLLMQEKKVLQEIIDNTSTLIYIKDPTGKFLMINKPCCEFFGLPSEKIIGKRDVDFFDKEFTDKFREADRRVFNEGRVVEAEEAAEMRGKRRIFLSIKFPLRNPEGNIYALCGMSIDITERKKYESHITSLNEQLKESVAKLQSVNRELEEFTYTVSHDLRAPLRAINGFASLLMLQHTEKKYDEETIKIVQLIRDHSLQMSQLIDDLLAFSRLGKYKPNCQLVNMRELLQQVVEDLKHTVNWSKVKWKTCSLESVQCDPKLIKQVWTNLISNAHKYSSKKEDQQIEVGCYESENELVYYVKDNGVGFDMKQYSRLFEIFQRLHTGEEFEGTGVGLAIVNRIVKRHGGRVWAESEPGKGAIFYFSLPKSPRLV